MTDTDRKSRAGWAYGLVCLGYLIFVIYGSVVPLKIQWMTFDEAWHRFWHMSVRLESRSDLVANVLLFVPLTFLAMGMLTRGGSRTPRRLAAAVLLCSAGLLSGLIEFAQVYLPDRTTALSDIVGETTGALIGIVCWSAFGAKLTGRLGRFWRAHFKKRRLPIIFIGYAMILVLYYLQPLDLSLSPKEVYCKFKYGEVTLVPFADLAEATPGTMIEKTLLMVPIGILLAFFARRRTYPVWTAVVWGGIFAAGVETLQLFVSGRHSSATDAILGAVGAGVGGLLAKTFGIARETSADQTVE